MLCALIVGVLHWSGIERRLKCWLYLNFCWGVISGTRSDPHDPFDPRKRETLFGCMGASPANGHHLKEWPQIPQFGHLTRQRETFSLCHSSIFERRCWRSSSAEIPNIEACSSRNFFRWLPVRRLLVIPEDFWAHWDRDCCAIDCRANVQLQLQNKTSSIHLTMRNWKKRHQKWFKRLRR